MMGEREGDKEDVEVKEGKKKRGRELNERER